MSQVTIDGHLVVNAFPNRAGGSLPFTLDGVDHTLGMLRNGHHDFGKAERQETLFIVTGTGVVNGRQFMADSLVCITPESPIVIDVDPETVMTYDCAYGILGALRMTTGRHIQLGLKNGQTVQIFNKRLEWEDGVGWSIWGSVQKYVLEEEVIAVWLL